LEDYLKEKRKDEMRWDMWIPERNGRTVIQGCGDPCDRQPQESTTCCVSKRRAGWQQTTGDNSNIISQFVYRIVLFITSSYHWLHRKPEEILKNPKTSLVAC
jgi:hypothetical protein